MVWECSLAAMEGDLAWFERNYSHLDKEIVRDVFHSVGPNPEAVVQHLRMLVRRPPASRVNRT